LNPRTWVPETSMLTTRPPKPLYMEVNDGWLYMRRKLLGIISVDFDATVQYSAFVKCLRKMGMKWSYSSINCILQEGLCFS
jgi:hypothetical protein